jgi:tetratricopeptide (TPR) repeat protein
MLLTLAACGSAPEKPAAPVDAVAAPAATTAATPAPEVTASKSKAAVADAASATAPVEVPVPPEAQQQFDSAVAAMSSGNLAGAEQAFRALSDNYPAYSGPLLNLAILQAKGGRLADAEKTLATAIERNDSAAAFNQLGIVYRRLGRFKEADEAYQRAIQIDPDYALAHLNLGVLCDLYLQQPQRALEAYERYLALAATPDAKVAGWVTELKTRLGNQQRSAQADQ